MARGLSECKTDSYAPGTHVNRAWADMQFERHLAILAQEQALAKANGKWHSTVWTRIGEARAASEYPRFCSECSRCYAVVKGKCRRCYNR